MQRATIRPIRAYWMMLLLGTLCGMIFWILWIFQLIKIRSYWRTMWKLFWGNHAIFSNHPSMKDPFMLLGPAWPWCIFFPNQYWSWSAPDVQYFKSLALWAYPLIRAIPVDRKNKNGREVVKWFSWAFQSKRNLIIHPEEGRTSSLSRDPNAPPTEYVYSSDRARKIRKITKVTTLRLVIKHGTEITPTYIDMPHSPGFGHWGLKTSTINFGQPYYPNGELTDNELLRDLEIRILQAGKE